jgi:hypothetical protein
MRSSGAECFSKDNASAKSRKMGRKTGVTLPAGSEARA